MTPRLVQLGNMRRRRLARALAVALAVFPSLAARAQDFNLIAVRGNVAEVEFLWHLPTGELREIALRIWTDNPEQVAPLKVVCAGEAGPGCTNVEYWLTNEIFPAPSGPCTKTPFFSREQNNMRRDRWRCAEDVRRDHGRCVYVDGWIQTGNAAGRQGLFIVSDYIVPDTYCSEKP